jgi:S-methylmethionine-dependent homocysteine/selenocysteine methylase
MARYRDSLPQLDGRLFLTDGGLETDLIFKKGYDLPFFAAFPLLETKDGRESLKNYYRPYMELAKKKNFGFILETPTWRSSRDWGNQLGYDTKALDRINREAVDLMNEIRNESDAPDLPTIISGCMGPRGDAYTAEEIMTVNKAAAYHRPQVATFADTDSDMITAYTMTSSAEAAGVALAARAEGMPVVISFTVETDGQLPSGESVEDAILFVDRETGNTPIYYMINCAHPTHFRDLFQTNAVRNRVKGIRANASSKSHEELDQAEELDIGNRVELGRLYADIKNSSNISVLGGCCGTDIRHMEEICQAISA